MKLRDMTELAVRNLRESILRNSLTTLGVAVGVASLVAMLSLGVGLQQLANSRLMKSGLELVKLSDLCEVPCVSLSLLDFSVRRSTKVYSVDVHD